MIDESGPTEATTNGNHGLANEHEPRMGPPTSSNSAIDERLEALLQTIRAWDWRQAVAEADLGVSSAVLTKANSFAESPEIDEGSVSLRSKEPEPESSEVSSDLRRIDQAPSRPEHGRHVAVESAQPAVSELIDPDTPSVSEPTSKSQLGPEQEPTSFGQMDVVDAERSAIDFPTPPAPTVGQPSPAWVHEDLASPVNDASPSQASVDTDQRVIEPVASSSSVAPPTAPWRWAFEMPASAAEDVAASAGGKATPKEAEAFTTHEESEVLTTQEMSIDMAAAAGTGIDESWFGPEPQLEVEPDSAIRRLWSHPTTKLAVFVVGAAVIVLLIIAGIRHFASNTSSSGPSLTTTSVTHHAASHSHFVAPISAAELTQYQTYATALQNANVTAGNDFAKAGASPTTSQLVLVVVAYENAVKAYDNGLVFIKWPPSMHSTIETDHAELQGLGSFLESFSTVAPSSVPAWLVQLRDRASSTEAVDNVVRKALGLSASTSFP